MRAIKTLQFYGMGYRSEDTENTATVTVTLDGNTVYTGSVPTKDLSEWDRTRDNQQILFTVDVPGATSTASMTITCTGGDSVDVNGIKCNLPFDDSDPTVFHIANWHADPRQNVSLDGVAQTKGPNANLFPANGEWTYDIPNGSVLAYNLVINMTE
jgi:hypothetical protein